MLSASFFSFGFFQLFFEFPSGYIDTDIGIFARFLSDEDLAVFCAGDYFDACFSGVIAVNDYFNFVNAVVVFGQFYDFFLRVVSQCVRYFNMFAADSYKHFFLLP